MGGLVAVLLALAQPEAAKTVASLAIETTDPERLAPLVGIVPGDVLTPGAVSKAVERLYATGEFEDVLVEQEEDGGGVRLTIRPVPAPLLDRIRVEGDRVLDAGRLAHIARLKRREPLWSGRLDEAAQAVAVALSSDGYLECRVTAAAARHGGGADAVFRVIAGPRVRVSSLETEGLVPGEEALLRGLLEPGPGEVFRRESARKAAEGLRRRLVDQGHWRAGVAVRESYDPARARIGLVFQASKGPRVSLEFRGDRPGSALRARVRGVVRDGAVQQDALEEGGERIEDALRAKGHRDARAQHRIEESPDAEVVVYDVEAGPASVAGRVQVVGEAQSGRELLLKTRPGLPIVEAAIEADVQTLTRALENDGHTDAQGEAELKDGGGEIPVLFRVKPGPRTVVESFTIDAPQGGRAGRELRTRVGRPYRARELALDRQALLTAWRNAGYLQAEVVPAVSFSEDRSLVTVVLQVLPGSRSDVDRIILKGLDRTRPAVVQREIKVREGEALGLSDLLESQRGLAALGIFERVTITEMEEDAQGPTSLLVEVEEAPATTFAYGLGYSEQDLLRGSLEVSRRNVLGMDRTLSAFVRASFRANRALVTYREPYLLGRKFELFLTGFREEEDREGFDFIRGGGLVQTALKLSPPRSLILRYAYKKTDTFNVTVPLSVVDRQFQDATFSGPSATLLEDTRDDLLDPRRGHFVSADLQLSLTALGGDSFLKSYFQAATYRHMTSRALVALSARVGLARTFGFRLPTGLPLPDRFFAGGDYSLRGFPIDGVDPAGGNGLLLGSLEMRFDLSRDVSLAAFSDAGNVYPFVSDMDLGNLRYAAGLGLRYRTAFGPLRVDWARKLDRRPGESASHFHLTVGHAF